MCLIINVIGSSSKGNCYLLEVGDERLIVECGSSLFFKLQKILDYDFSKVRGALISHAHKDHCGDVKKLLQRGIHVLSTSQVFNGLDQFTPFCHIAEHLHGYTFGKFKVVPITMRHDIECFSFLILIDGKKILFIIDTSEIPFIMPQVDYLMIEANHSQKILHDNFYNGKLVGYLHDRILRSHLSIEKAQKFIQTQKKLRGILLMHLSGDNAEPELFQKSIAEQTGVPTSVAISGTKVCFI